MRIVLENKRIAISCPVSLCGFRPCRKAWKRTDYLVANRLRRSQEQPGWMWGDAGCTNLSDDLATCCFYGTTGTLECY